MTRILFRFVIGKIIDWLLNISHIRQHYTVGDRVLRINEQYSCGYGWVACPSWRGDGWYRIRFDQGSTYYIHFTDLLCIPVDEKDIPEDLKRIRDLIKEKI